MIDELNLISLQNLQVTANIQLDFFSCIPEDKIVFFLYLFCLRINSWSTQNA